MAKRTRTATVSPLLPPQLSESLALDGARKSCGFWLGILTASLLWLEWGVVGAEVGPAQVVAGSSSRATVVFVARVINGGTAPLLAPSILMHTPIASPHQDVLELEVEGKPERRVDKWGCTVLQHQRAELAAQASLVGRWAAWADIRRFQWDLAGKTAAAGPALSPDEQALSVRDGKDLALGHPVVKQAAQHAALGRTGAVEVLDGVFGLVMDRLSYDRDGKWDPVPAVLTSGKGSCSEYTYTFMALARDNDIATRYVGGIVGRVDAPFHLDRVFHRFPQAYVPGAGWVDFDPTRTDRANNKRLYFGQTPGPMLLLSVGDGGEGSLTGADYLESHSWADPKARASSLRQAWWFPPPSAALRTRVRAFASKLEASAGPQRGELVEEALRIADPFVLPWLDDLLYERQPRVAAARACLKIGGRGELAAIVNCLERLADADGDRQIGRLLDEFTGQRLGHSRSKWNEWLKAQTPRTPLPGDEPAKKR